MEQILVFIFNCLKSIINLLNFNLPGLSLSFLDFILLAMVIPVLFAVIKGAVGNAGVDSVYSGLRFGYNTTNDINKISHRRFLEEQSELRREQAELRREEWFVKKN